MVDGVSMDFTEILKLSADLGVAPVKAGPKIHQATEITARKIKDGWSDDLEGTPDVPHGSRTITYDIGANTSIIRDLTQPIAHQNEANTIMAEIGAEDGRQQAPIVAVLEYGAPSKNLPPHGYGAGELQKYSDDFEHGLSLAIGDPL